MIANPKMAALASGGPLPIYDPFLMIGSTNDEAWMPWSTSPPLLEENRATAGNVPQFIFDAAAEATNFVQHPFGANIGAGCVLESQNASEGRMWDAVMAVCAKVLDGHCNSQPECARQVSF